MIGNMAFLAWFALSVGQGKEAPKVALFSDGLLNLQFERPVSWKQGPPVLKKGQKPARDTIYFTIPIKDSKEVAYLELVRTSFSGAVDTWQTVQSGAFNQTKREVVRQWQQDILGVPMLFTKGVGIDASVPRTYLAGLMYVRGPYKMLVKVNAPTVQFDLINTEIFSAFESMRTIDGTALEAEDPNRKFDPLEWKNRTRITKPIQLPTGETMASTRGLASTPFEVANRKMVLRTPSTFKVKINKSILELSNEAGISMGKFELFSTLDSDSPRAVVARHAARSLEQFDKVNNRADSENTNGYGCQVQSYWREGVGADGKPVFSYAFAFGNADVYGFLGANGKDKVLAKADFDKLKRALGMISIEVGK